MSIPVLVQDVLMPSIETTLILHVLSLKSGYMNADERTGVEGLGALGTMGHPLPAMDPTVKHR